MAKKQIKFKEAKQFAEENGYRYAVYELKDNNYCLLETVLWDTDIDDNTDIIVNTVSFIINIGTGIDFNEFVTIDKKYCFRLHNNFNIPDVIPVFPEK